MCPGNDNQVDWTAAATTPGGERVGPGLSGRTPAGRSASETLTRRGVMDTLLGENDLSAYDASGNDPYNTTGKSFRR
jgi:hypothetical protein